MGTRMIHKRDKKHAAHVSKIALRMMAVLVMSGDYIPACVMGMIHREEHRRSLQREMHWRKTYASDSFLMSSPNFSFSLASLSDVLRALSIRSISATRLFISSARAISSRVAEAPP